MRVRAFAVFALFVVLATSCTSGGDPKPTPSATPTSSAPMSSTVSTPPTTPTATTPSSPTVPADVPTTGPNVKPGERPPVMPLAATKHTAAGARAFAKFFIQTIDWGYATTNSTYMKRYFQSGCHECIIVRASLDNTARQKQHFVGGRVVVATVGTVTAGGPKSAAYTVNLKVDIEAAEIASTDGSLHDPIQGFSNYGEAISSRWVADSWTVVWLAGA